MLWSRKFKTRNHNTLQHACACTLYLNNPVMAANPEIVVLFFALVFNLYRFILFCLLLKIILLVPNFI